MKSLVMLASLFLFVSCGVEVEGVPDEVGATVTIDDGYAELFALCDARYGQGTDASEECIADGKEYRKFKAEYGIDTDILEVLEAFCEGRSDSESCFADLGDALLI